jgi:hypothetical protein
MGKKSKNIIKGVLVSAALASSACLPKAEVGRNPIM